jgi:hypothetical protein
MKGMLGKDDSTGVRIRELAVGKSRKLELVVMMRAKVGAPRRAAGRHARNAALEPSKLTKQKSHRVTGSRQDRPMEMALLYKGPLIFQAPRFRDAQVP